MVQGTTGHRRRRGRAQSHRHQPAADHPGLLRGSLEPRVRLGGQPEHPVRPGRTRSTTRRHAPPAPELSSSASARRARSSSPIPARSRSTSAASISCSRTTRRWHRRRATRPTTTRPTGSRSSRARTSPTPSTTPSRTTRTSTTCSFRTSAVLDQTVDLDLLAGFSPQGAVRTAPQGGDSPLGNLHRGLDVAATRRADRLLDDEHDGHPDRHDPGPGDDGGDVQHLPVQQHDHEDAALRHRGAGDVRLHRGSIAGARVRLAGANRRRAGHPQLRRVHPRVAANNAVHRRRPVHRRRAGQLRRRQRRRLPAGRVLHVRRHGVRRADLHRPPVQLRGEQPELRLPQDSDCPDQLQGQCDTAGGTRPSGTCLAPLHPHERLRLRHEQLPRRRRARASSCSRTTRRSSTRTSSSATPSSTSSATRRPCGYSKSYGDREGLMACSTDADCQSAPGPGADFVCACPGQVTADGHRHGADVRDERLVRPERRVAACARTAATTWPPSTRPRARASPDDRSVQHGPRLCSLAGEECKILSCVDENLGALTDNRVQMVGR